MKKNNIKKILIIISIIIICAGIVSGLSLSNELKRSLHNEKIYVDGSDFSTLGQASGTIGTTIMGIVIVIYSILIDAIIWLIYGIILIIIKKLNNKKAV